MSRARFSAAITLVGAVVLLLACIVPYGQQICDVCPVNHNPSLFSDEAHRVSWLAVEPIAAIVLSVLGGIAVVMARRTIEMAIVGGLLGAAGLLALAFFLSFSFLGVFVPGEGASIAGVIGSFLVAVGGAVVAAGAWRESRPVEAP